MRSLTAEQCKASAAALGADLCGVASAASFHDAPEGFRPHDIYAGAESVVVLAKRLPESVFSAAGPVPYTFACEIVLHQVFRITCEMSLRLQDEGTIAVPVPSEPYEYWDPEKNEGRGILSLRHAGFLAGLGVMGRNGLLTNPVFGNRIVLGALLVNAALKEDPPARYDFCSGECRMCIESCPGKALDGMKIIQQRCREASITETAKGYSLYTCHACRSVCPGGMGSGAATLK